MALEVYFRNDIRNALLAAEHASMSALRISSTENSEFAQGYAAGCRETLRSLALNFGLVQINDCGESQVPPPIVNVSSEAQVPKT